MKKFIIYWQFGDKTEIEGMDEADAMRRSGHGAGCMSAIDFIGPKESEDSWKYDEDNHRWVSTGIPYRPARVQDYKPFDVVVYKPTGERGLVKSVTDSGVFVLFRIQSTAAKCKYEDLELE